MMKIRGMRNDKIEWADIIYLIFMKKAYIPRYIEVDLKAAMNVRLIANRAFKIKISFSVCTVHFHFTDWCKAFV